VVTVEDNVLAGGFGSAMLEFMSTTGLCRLTERIGLPDMFVCHGSLEMLRRDVGLTPEAIAQTAAGLAVRTRNRPGTPSV
jgi:1-deoxy-D-xylulose-5-phosphate synthase